MNIGLMISENEVIETVAKHLKEDGWTIIQKLTTSQKGIDLIASKENRTLYVEAKGGTSSLKSSSRYGKPFDGNQAKSHIGAALWKIGQTMTERPDGEFALALPNETTHRLLINEVKSMLLKLNLKIYWVDLNNKIEIEHDHE